ncbi:MAG TPA: choice-of-anchor X domain-containing protein, partial [Candidatus Paceibacterota bacterium]|nr:choice-of-anchor X domain-containing protein [Candidatus Paceibacterota bacterium]
PPNPPTLTHTITINLQVAGVHTPQTTVTVNDGSNVTIPFTMDAGWTNFTINGVAASLNYALTNVKTDLTLNASATAPVVTHTITINTGTGVHTPSNSVTVNHGSNVSIPFTLDANYTNLVVTGGNGTLTGLTYALTNVTADLTLNASATAPANTHTVTINAGPGIRVPNTTITVNDGSTVQFIFTLDIGYRDPVASGLGSSCYFLSIRNYNCTSDPIHQDGQITLTATVDDRYALQYIRSSDNVLFTNEFNTKPITIEVRAAGANFTLYAEYNAATFGTLPYAIVKEQLYDDGTHGDVTAGDGVYTKTFTLTPPAVTRFHDHTAEWMRLDVFAYDSGGNKVNSIIDMATNINIGVIDPSQTVGNALVATNVYASTNSVNVVVPGLSDGPVSSSTITKTLYQVYPDDFDMAVLVYVGNTRAFNGFTGNWPHTDLVKITETGLGIAPQDLTAEYGSAGKLQSVLSLDNDIVGMSFIHEFGHRWSFFLNDVRLKLTDISGVHVATPTTLVGQHTSGYFLAEQPGGDFLVTSAPDAGFNLGNKFSDWELYFMGFRSPADVAAERFVLNSSVPQSPGTIVPRASTDLIPVIGPSGSQSLEGIYGVRTPVASVSQHNFKVLFVAVSDRPLTLAETSMINRDAVYYGSQIEGRDILYDWMPDFRTMPTFWSATKYLGLLDTSVPAPK